MEKILIISNMYPSDRGPTFGIFIKNQAKQLELAGLSVDILAINNPSMRKIDVIKKYLYWLWAFLLNFLTKGWKYDIVHVHYVFPSGLLGLFYKKMFKKPMIVTAHGGDIDKMAKKNKVFHKLTDMILKEADYIICVGDQLYSNIVNEYNIPTNKITVLNMGVDTKVFKPINQEILRKKYGIPVSVEIILFVGNIIKSKGVMDLVKAYHRMKDNYKNIQLYIIGAKKEPDFLNRLEHYIKEQGIKDIFILEPKTQKEIAEWMNMANVFVLPSHMEGLGLVALEAMACKVPVVASKVGGLQYLLANGNGVLVSPKNELELEVAIKSIVDDGENVEQMINNAYQKAMESESKIVLNKLLDIYSLVKI